MSGQDLTGQHLGKYRLLRLLGRGGMGEVYLAEHDLLQNQVAVKVLPAELSREQEMRERFLREARSAAGLRHPNIIRIHDVDQAGEVNYFAMDYVQGRPLTEVIGGGPMPASEILRVSRQVLSALEAAHQAGIIHRDIKPDNVVIDERGDAVVMDFGIAKAMRATRMTTVGSFLGTAHYASPEQARGLEVDARSDLYSWGVVMYEMATGQVPFDGQDTTAILYQHVHEPPRPPHELAGLVPESLSAFILHLMEKDPAARFPNARHALAALEQLDRPARMQAPAEHGPGGAPTRIWSPQQVSPAGQAPVQRQAKSAGSRVGLWAGLAVAVAIAVGGGLWFAGRPEAPPPAQPANQATPAPTAQPPAADRQAELRAMVEEGQRRLAAGDLEGAARFFRQALAREADYAPAQAGQAAVEAAHQERQRQEAQDKLRQAREMLQQEKLDRAEALYRQALAADPGSGEARQGLEQALKRRAVLEHLEKEAARQAQTRAAAAAKVEEGWSLLGRGELDQAEAAFRQALVADPNSHAAKSGLAEAAERRAAASKADGERRRQAQAQARLTEAQAALKKNDLDGARARLDQARSLDPGLAGAAQAQADLDRRRAELDRAAKPAGREPDRRAQAQAKVKEGLRLLAQGRSQPAAAAFREALDADPGNREAAQGLKQAGQAAAEAQPPAQAPARAAPSPKPEPAPQPAAPADGPRPQELLVEGVKHFNEGRYQQAAGNFEKVLLAYPNDTVVQDYLAQARKLAQESQAGTLVVECRVKAEIYLDGKRVGVAPLRLTGVAVGRHALEARAFGGAAKAEVEIQGRATTRLQMEVLGGSLSVESQPKARVFLGDHPLGETPLSVENLPVGPARLRLVSPGHRELILDATLAADKPVRLTLTLAPQ